jgi:hypothetical protein
MSSAMSYGDIAVFLIELFSSLPPASSNPAWNPIRLTWLKSLLRVVQSCSESSKLLLALNVIMLQTNVIFSSEHSKTISWNDWKLNLLKDKSLDSIKSSLREMVLASDMSDAWSSESIHLQEKLNFAISTAALSECLLTIEKYTPWSKFTPTWISLRKIWISRLDSHAGQSVSFFKVRDLLLQFEKNLISSSFLSDYQENETRQSWRKLVLICTRPLDLGNCILDLVFRLSSDVLGDFFSELRPFWTECISSAVHPSEIAAFLSDLQHFTELKAKKTWSEVEKVWTENLKRLTVSDEQGISNPFHFLMLHRSACRSQGPASCF